MGLINVMTLDGSTPVRVEVDGSNTRHQGYILCDDPTVTANVARVLAADPAPTDKGVVVRVPGLPSGPFTAFRRMATGTDTAVIKGSAGAIYAGHAMNMNTFPVFWKLYAKATAPVPASDTPFKVVMIPALGQVDLSVPLLGWAFANGISMNLVQGLADTDETGVGANTVLVHLDRV